jgi:hypothetical protein
MFAADVLVHAFFDHDGTTEGREKAHIAWSTANSSADLKSPRELSRSTKMRFLRTLSSSEEVNQASEGLQRAFEPLSL